MEKVFTLYNELHSAGVKCFSWDLDGETAAVIKMDNKYALFIDTNTVNTIPEETVIVAHEMGHIATGTTHCICSPYELIERHEYRANKWAIRRLIPKDELYSYYNQGYTEPWEIAEQINLPESFVSKAMTYYHEQELAEAE